MTEPVYITSLDEIFWGSVMIAGTMIIHGAGVISTLRFVKVLQRRARADSFLYGMGTLVTATLLLVLVHIGEVMVWGLFLESRDAFVNTSTTMYYSLMQYTTVGSAYSLPSRLQLLGGLIALSGILTVAWTTSVLFLVGQPFVNRYTDRTRDRSASQ